MQENIFDLLWSIKYCFCVPAVQQTTCVCRNLPAQKRHQCRHIRKKKKKQVDLGGRTVVVDSIMFQRWRGKRQQGEAKMMRSSHRDLSRCRDSGSGSDCLLARLLFLCHHDVKATRREFCSGSDDDAVNGNQVMCSIMRDTEKRLKKEVDWWWQKPPRRAGHAVVRR